MPLPAPLVALRQRTGPLVFAWMAGLATIHLFFLFAVGVFRSDLAFSLYYGQLALSPAGLLGGKVWTLLTYGLLHDLDSILHVLGNLLGLYFFGPVTEKVLGKRRFVQLVVLSVVLGGLAQVLWQLLLGHNAPIVGASAAIMAMLAVYTWQRPDAQILLFFVVPVRARYLVPIVLGIDVLSALSGTPLAVAAHFTGVGVAWFLVQAGGNPRVAWVRLRALVGLGSTSARSVGKGGTVHFIDKARRGPWDVN